MGSICMIGPNFSDRVAVHCGPGRIAGLCAGLLLMVFAAIPTLALTLALALALTLTLIPSPGHAQECRRPLYLTLDTGGMQSAELIAATLRRHDVRATFFLANEKTFRGDYALDDSWAVYWRDRAAEGHAFGSHTWRHGRILAGEGGAIRYRPQFGESQGRVITMSSEEFCGELRRVGERFVQMTGRRLDPLWRAPGGHTTPASLAAAQSCGFAHVHWSPAGFLGDELPSDRYPNRMLLERALRDIRPGDVLMAHLGIWSRKDPYAPMLDPLIAGLKEKGFCFLTLAQAPAGAKLPR